MCTTQSEVVEFSVRVYQALLWLYPAEHRDEYGWLMVQLFRDKAYDAIRRAGAVGVLGYWLVALLDLIYSIVEERREEGIAMSSSNIHNLNPYLLMAAGALFAVAGSSQLQPDDQYSFYGGKWHWWNKSLNHSLLINHNTRCDVYGKPKPAAQPEESSSTPR